MRLCLWDGPVGARRDSDCVLTDGRKLTRRIGAGTSRWNVSGVGLDVNVVPTARVTIAFPTRSPAIRIGGFRFQGVGSPGYAGATLVVDSGARGPIAVDARGIRRVRGASRCVTPSGSGRSPPTRAAAAPPR